MSDDEIIHRQVPRWERPVVPVSDAQSERHEKRKRRISSAQAPEVRASFRFISTICWLLNHMANNMAWLDGNPLQLIPSGFNSHRSSEFYNPYALAYMT